MRMPACWLPFLKKALPRDEGGEVSLFLRSGEGHAARQRRERPGSGAGRARAPAVADAVKKSAVREGMPGQGRRDEADRAGRSR